MGTIYGPTGSPKWREAQDQWAEDHGMPMTRREVRRLARRAEWRGLIALSWRAHAMALAMLKSETGIGLGVNWPNDWEEIPNA